MSVFLLSHFLLLIFRLSFLYPSFYLSSYVIYIILLLSHVSFTSFLSLSFLTHSFLRRYLLLSYLFLLSLSFLHFLKVSNVIFILYSLLHSFRFKKSLVTGLNFYEVSFVNGKYNPISLVGVSNQTVSFYSHKFFSSSLNYPFVLRLIVFLFRLSFLLQTYLSILPHYFFSKQR